MNRRKNLWFQGAALLLIAITALLAPGTGAQSKYKSLHKFRADTGGCPLRLDFRPVRESVRHD